MAQSVQLRSSGSFAKLRNPWAVLGLTLVTLGIYMVFWWYFANREMRDFGQAHNTDLGHSPGLSALAVSLGSLLIVPLVVTMWKTGQRINHSQAAAGGELDTSIPVLFFVLTLFTGIGGMVYGQYVLNNKVWRKQGELTVA